LDNKVLGFKYSKRQLAGAGIQTAALGFGGNTGTYSTATEEYDGSIWTSTTSMKQQEID
jgi:hypothetical protein